MLEDCNFKVNSSSSPRTFEVSTTNSTGAPTRYKLTKKVKAISGEVTTETFPFGAASKYDSILLYIVICIVNLKLYCKFILYIYIVNISLYCNLYYNFIL